MIRQPYGLLLVTGPTGAGKTTTLYALLEQLNDGARNILTVEEPIEFDLDRVNQTAVDRKLGLGFAECLRACFRHDPDILMVGEIRDPESARIAVRAALSGHLVLSSLHTGSAFGAFAALVHLGISPFLVSSALIGVITQQLVRTLCPKCRQSHSVNPELIDPGLWAQLGAGSEGRTTDGKCAPLARLSTGVGCPHCRQTGYRGRTGLFEVLDVTPAIREALAARVSRARLEQLAKPLGWRRLLHSGWSRVIHGTTTIEELLRVVPAHAEPEVGHDWTPHYEHD